MYSIINIKDGKQMCLTDEIVYIKLSKSGTLIPADENTAVGIACNGMPYNLIGHNEIKDAETVTVTETDGGLKITENSNEILKSMLATADLAKTSSDKYTKLELAIADLAKVFFGGKK